MDDSNLERILPLPVTRHGWGHGRARAVSSRFCQTADLGLMASVFLLLAVAPVLGRSPQGWNGFFQIRITLQDVVIGLLCMGAWRAILSTIGMYSGVASRSVWDYLFRCMIGLNSCAAVVGIVEVVLRRNASVWEAIGIFWIANLVLLAALRGLLMILEMLGWGPR